MQFDRYNVQIGQSWWISRRIAAILELFFLLAKTATTNVIQARFEFGVWYLIYACSKGRSPSKWLACDVLPDIMIIAHVTSTIGCYQPMITGHHVLLVCRCWPLNSLHQGLSCCLLLVSVITFHSSSFTFKYWNRLNFNLKFTTMQSWTITSWKLSL